jgi:hypothetical protein
MLEAGDDPDLAEEAVGAEAGRDLGAQHLERHLPLVAKVAREVHPGHAPLADQAEDLIPIG